MVKKHLTELETMQAYNAFKETEAFERPNVSLITDGNVVVFAKSGQGPTPPAHDYSQDYLTIVARENINVMFLCDDLLVSDDEGETWRNGDLDNPTPLNSGQKLMIKGNVKSTINLGSNAIFTSDGTFDVEGNVMSMYDSDGFRTRTEFDDSNDSLQSLFAGLYTLISAENLVMPVTTLNAFCYCNMFMNCENLTIAPALPATTLAEGCYQGMFDSCTSLTTAPALPATTLADNCYQQMFYNCTSLTTAPALPATTLAQSCYINMFNGCENLNYIESLATDISAIDCDTWVQGVSETGTFVKAAGVNWPTGDSGIPEGWTVQEAS